MVRNSNLHLLYQTIRVWLGFDNVCKLPLIAKNSVILEQHNIIGLDVGMDTVPYLTFLQGQKEVLLPTVPKFVRQMLNSTPSLARIQVCMLEIPWWWQENVMVSGWFGVSRSCELGVVNPSVVSGLLLERLRLTLRGPTSNGKRQRWPPSLRSFLLILH